MGFFLRIAIKVSAKVCKFDSADPNTLTTVQDILSSIHGLLGG